MRSSERCLRKQGRCPAARSARQHPSRLGNRATTTWLSRDSRAGRLTDAKQMNTPGSLMTVEGRGLAGRMGVPLNSGATAMRSASV